jgi:hypothetical protein
LVENFAVNRHIKPCNTLVDEMAASVRHVCRLPFGLDERVATPEPRRSPQW